MVRTVPLPLVSDADGLDRAQRAVLEGVARGRPGFIETSSGDTANCQREMTRMEASGQRLPPGANLSIRFLTEGVMLRFVCDAFALGPEGIQMGTRSIASDESSVHDHF